MKKDKVFYSMETISIFLNILNVYEFKVYSYLKSLDKAHKKEIQPTITIMAQYLDISEWSVKGALKNLDNLNIIRKGKLGKFKNNATNRNVYYLYDYDEIENEQVKENLNNYLKTYKANN